MARYLKGIGRHATVLRAADCCDAPLAVRLCSTKLHLHSGCRSQSSGIHLKYQGRMTPSGGPWAWERHARELPVSSWQGLHVGWGVEAGKSGGRPSPEYFTYHAIIIISSNVLQTSFSNALANASKAVQLDKLTAPRTEKPLPPFRAYKADTDTRSALFHDTGEGPGKPSQG
jgi:hypothetical protein